MIDDRAMEVWIYANEAWDGSPNAGEGKKAAAAIIAQALAAERKARDAEICAWLRGKDNGYPEGAGYRDAANAIERGEV